jgi:hypothetical protein
MQIRQIRFCLRVLFCVYVANAFVFVADILPLDERI